jgi:hypothetical protein
LKNLSTFSKLILYFSGRPTPAANSALAIDTLVELTKDNYPGSTRYNAATALLDRATDLP